MENDKITALVPDENGILRYGDAEKLLIFSNAKHWLDTNTGLCGAIEDALMDLDITYHPDRDNDPYFEMKDAFPEIYQYKPNINDVYWFGYNGINSSGYLKRLDILNTEIEILKQKLNK